MDKKWWIIIVFLLIVVVFFIGYSLNSGDDSRVELSECEILAQTFDSQAEDGSLFPQVGLEESDVGGTLVKIESLEGYQSMAQDLEAYRLYFKGTEKEASLLLTTTTGKILPYEVSSFYKFNLVDIRVSGAHSGEFIDRDLDKLVPMFC